MIALLRLRTAYRLFLIALPLALCLMVVFPGISEAHAILLRSDPVRDAILDVPPQQVRMWFSEDLNPALSTAVVVNGDNQRADNRDAHVSSSDPREMDVTLASNLPPAVYIVVWRTDSNADGHILSGSFLFTVARPDGTVPTLSGNTIPGQNALGGGNLTGLYTGQLDGPSLFNLIMITLVEVGAVFWVGAQLWFNFVLQPSGEEHTEESATNQRVQQRFERRFSLPTLLLILLANVGVLVGQALNITGGQLAPALAPQLLTSLVANGRFGSYWLMREVVVLLAIALALYILLFKKRSSVVNTVLSWANLLLGLALFIAITMSGHAAAVNGNVVAFAVMVDWLHLLAAAFWVGGMMYISAIYLPILSRNPVAERARSLITVLPRYSPWALAGVGLMAVTGPFSATFHLNSWAQLFTTAYGRALVVKILLVVGLLITSFIHVRLLRPRLAKEYKKYAYVAACLQATQTTPAPIALPTNEATPESTSTPKFIAQQVKLREGRLAKRTQRLMKVLRWEPLLGIAVLTCVGLMNVFAGTLSPIAVAQQQPSKLQAKPFNTTVKTSDGKYSVTLNVNPNTFGTNVFTVRVVDTSTNKPTTDVGVSLYTTMLDMDMGTDTVNLLPDGKGNFSARGDLSMAGNWQIRIQIRTPDNTLHEAIAKLFTPF